MVTAGGAFATFRGDLRPAKRTSFTVTPAASSSISGIASTTGWTSVASSSGCRSIFGRPDSHHPPGRRGPVPAMGIAGVLRQGGAGMAFVRNWVDAVGPDPINPKALSVVIGAGWAFRWADRVGLQVFGAQHVAAIADLRRPKGPFKTRGQLLVARCSDCDPLTARGAARPRRHIIRIRG